MVTSALLFKNRSSTIVHSHFSCLRIVPNRLKNILQWTTSKLFPKNFLQTDFLMIYGITVDWIKKCFILRNIFECSVDVKNIPPNAMYSCSVCKSIILKIGTNRKLTIKLISFIFWKSNLFIKSETKNPLLLYAKWLKQSKLIFWLSRMILTKFW